MNEQFGTKTTLRQEAQPPSKAEPAPQKSWISDHRRWLAIGAVLILAAVGGAAWWSMRSSTTAQYVTVPATRGSITRAVTATGTVNPELTIIVGSYVSGVILQLYCDYNTQVRAGQICAKIDPRPYQALVNQQKASVALAKAQLEKDKANLVYTKITNERLQRLVALDSASKDAVDVAKNAYDQNLAQIDLDQATIQQDQALLEAAEVNLFYTDIASPVEGTVVSRAVTQGQTVASTLQTPTLFLIATDLTNMQVDTNVSEGDIGGVKEGNAATFTVDAFPKRIFQGKVTQVRQSPQTVQNVVTFDAVVGVDNRDGALLPGMTASTRIIIDKRDDVIRVPNQALRFTLAGPSTAATSEAAPAPTTGTETKPSAGETVRLWVLRDGKPVPLIVVPGLDDDNFTEIVKGDLQEGDEVIVGEEIGSNKDRSKVPLPHL
ncbi:MAG: efflux RND transporter periplasmic adaptor subunit [Beijerinckiaceae bacterium]